MNSQVTLCIYVVINIVTCKMYEAPDGDFSSWKCKIVLILINISYKRELNQGLFLHLYKLLLLWNFFTISTPEEKLVGVYPWLDYSLRSLVLRVRVFKVCTKFKTPNTLGNFHFTPVWQGSGMKSIYIKFGLLYRQQKAGIKLPRCKLPIRKQTFVFVGMTDILASLKTLTQASKTEAEFQEKLLIFQLQPIKLQKEKWLHLDTRNVQTRRRYILIREITLLM